MSRRLLDDAGKVLRREAKAPGVKGKVATGKDVGMEQLEELVGNVLMGSRDGLQGFVEVDFIDFGNPNEQEGLHDFAIGGMGGAQMVGGDGIVIFHQEASRFLAKEHGGHSLDFL